MRKLKSSDVFGFIRCIKKIGIKDKLAEIAKNADNYKDAADAGFIAIYDIFDKATEENGEKEIYKFLAPIAEMKPEEIEDLPAVKFIELLKTIAEENDLKSFFSSALSLAK